MSSPNKGMSSPNKGTPAERGRSQQRTGAQRRPESPDLELCRVEPLSEDSEPESPAGPDTPAGHDNDRPRARRARERI